MIFMRVLLALSLLVTTALADVAISRPVKGTVWRAGQSVTVGWVAGPKGFEQGKTIAIVLRKGSEGNMATIKSLGNENEGKGSFSLTVPSDIPNGEDYAIQVGDNYSHFFTIQGAGGATSVSSSTSATPTSSISNSKKPTLTTSDTTKSEPTRSSSPAPKSDVARTVDRTGVSLLALLPVALLAFYWY